MWQTRTSVIVYNLLPCSVDKPSPSPTVAHPAVTQYLHSYSFFTGDTRQSGPLSAGESTSSAVMQLTQGGTNTQALHSHSESSSTMNESCYTDGVPLLLIITKCSY